MLSNASLGALGILQLGFLGLGVFYALLPLLIYWRCGRILRRIRNLERLMGDEA